MRAVKEHVPSVAGESFAAFAFSLPRFNIPYHYHPEVEIALVRAGRGQRLIGDHFGHFGPGDLVLIGSDLPHYYFNATDFDEGPDGTAASVIQFRPDMGRDFLSEMPECLAVRQLLERAKRGITFSPRVRARAEGLMQDLLKAEGLLRLIGLLDLLCLLASDTQSVALSSAGFEPDYNPFRAQRIRETCDWMTEHFSENITLEDAAKRAHMTPGAFGRLFVRATSRPFKRFLNELRVGNACQLLLDTEKSVSEIAFASGFDNLSHFNRQFLRLRKITPTSYRAIFVKQASKPATPKRGRKKGAAK